MIIGLKNSPSRLLNSQQFALLASGCILFLCSVRPIHAEPTQTPPDPSQIKKSVIRNEDVTLRNAQNAYAKGDIIYAYQILQRWIQAHPSDAEAHYLKANCLVKNGSNAEASYEYARAEQLAPSSKLAEYCKSAQMHLANSSAVQKVSSQKQESDDSENAEPGNETTEVKNTPDPGDSNLSRTSRKNNKLPPGTIELIRKQALMARERAVADGAHEAENERIKASTEAKSLQEKAERLTGHARAGNEPVVLTPEEKERLKSQSAETIERMKEVGEWKAAQAEEGSRYKAEEIRRQSESLQEQLLDLRAGGSKLNPVGTNLYIRNYAKPPVPALRTQMQMRSLSTNTDANLTSNQTSLKIRGNNQAKTLGPTSARITGGGKAEAVVKGEVLDK